MTRKSDAARTKSISNEANNQTLSWTIGSKPSVDSNKGRFSECAIGQEGIRDISGERGGDKGVVSLFNFSTLEMKNSLVRSAN